MSSTLLTFLVCAVVITITMAAFAAWVRPKNSVPASKTKIRAITAFLVATIVLGTSMTMFARFVGVSAPVFAATVTMVTLGWTAFAYGVVPVRLPNSLRRIRPWELSRFPYRTLGVAAFGRLLRTSPLRHLNPAVYLKASSGDGESVRAQMEIAEDVHFWATVLTVPSSSSRCSTAGLPPRPRFSWSTCSQTSTPSATSASRAADSPAGATNQIPSAQRAGAS